MINGPKIRAMRKAKGLTLRKLSELTGNAISPSYLSEIENGIALNPSKRVSRLLAKTLGVMESELFNYPDNLKGEFEMCKYRMEFPTMNGWVYYCNLVANAQVFTKKELEDIGCTVEKRAKCKQMMELTCGMGIVPEPKE